LNSELTYIFNKTGLLLRSEGLDQDISYTYSFDNQEVGSRIYLKNGVEYARNELFYNNGNLIKHIYRDIQSKYVYSKNEYFATHYIYNSENKLIEEKGFGKEINSPNETLEIHKKYQYDKNGDCIIDEDLEDGKVIQKSNKKYLNHKLKESFTWQSFEGCNLYIKDLYEYNQDDIILSHTNTIYDYNSTEKIMDQTIVNYTYKYNDQKQLTEICEFASKSKSKTEKFSNFDLNGNWHKKTVNEDGELKITLREFEYYK
jgi:hypothetical protein